MKCCLCHVLLLFAITAHAERAPNIILLMSDDQGWGDVGFNGNADIRTPHLDAMAKNGMRFDRFYASAPLCSPTRASCLTGRFPFRMGILAAHTAGMRVGEITIAEALRSKGYATGFFGKWHMGWVKPDEPDTRGFYSPPDHHGFDQYFATTGAMPTWDPQTTPAGWKSSRNLPGKPWKNGTAYIENGSVVTTDLEGDSSRVIMDRVLPFLAENKVGPDPFFATVWFHAPHEPVVAGPRYKAMYPKAGETRKNYYGCITAMDEQIGRLREQLRTWGIEQDTFLFFCSDNGPSGHLKKKGVASAGPFKGHKHTMYEGGLLVPACAEWPGTIPPGGQTAVRCATVDFFPTIVGLAGYTFSENRKRPIDGIDLMPVITGKTTSRGKDLFFGYRRLVSEIDGMAIISGDEKLLREAEPDGRIRLYDLAKDPHEKNDLAAEQPEKVKALMRRMLEIDASCQRSRDGADYRY